MFSFSLLVIICLQPKLPAPCLHIQSHIPYLSLCIYDVHIPYIVHIPCIVHNLRLLHVFVGGRQQSRRSSATTTTTPTTTTPTTTTPCFVHFNGWSVERLDAAYQACLSWETSGRCNTASSSTSSSTSGSSSTSASPSSSTGPPPSPASSAEQSARRNPHVRHLLTLYPSRLPSFLLSCVKEAVRTYGSSCSSVRQTAVMLVEQEQEQEQSEGAGADSTLGN